MAQWLAGARLVGVVKYVDRRAMVEKGFTNDPNVYGTFFGNVTGDLTGNVTGNADTATLAGSSLGLEYTTTSPSAPVITWNSGSSTIGGATFTRSTVIPLDGTYGINFVSLYIEFTGVTAVNVPFTIKLNSNNAVDTTNVDVINYNTAGSSSRAMKGLLTASGDTISIPAVYGLTVAVGTFFTANFSYKCTL